MLSVWLKNTSYCILASHLEWGPPLLRDFINVNTQWK